MRLVFALIGVTATVITITEKPLPIVLHERAETRIVCAEYTTVGAEHRPSRSCVDASVVRAYILRNAELDQCH